MGWLLRFCVERGGEMLVIDIRANEGLRAQMNET